jgi:hypothetical protein
MGRKGRTEHLAWPDDAFEALEDLAGGWMARCAYFLGQKERVEERAEGVGVGG